jgi:hypothetical protein
MPCCVKAKAKNAKINQWRQIKGTEAAFESIVNRRK